MILTHFLLQAIQQAQPIFVTPSGGIDNGPNIWIVLSAVGAAIIAIGTLIGWIIKLVVPKALDSFDKRTETLSKAVDSIPVAIDKVGVLIAEVRTDIKTTISSVEDRIIGAIQDQKLKEISNKLDEHDQKLKDLSSK